MSFEVSLFQIKLTVLRVQTLVSVFEYKSND
jgi:hypothetical protein